MSEEVQLWWYECKLKNCREPVGLKETSRGAAEMQRDRHIAIFHPRVIRMKHATFKIRKT